MRAVKPWTVLLYGAGAGKLHQPIYDKIDALEEVVADRVTVVAQIDQPGYQGARRYELHPDGVGGRITSEGHGVGLIDMADPARLADFVEWGMLNYPAAHTALIVVGEGNGWHSLLRDETVMTPATMAQGLALARERVGPLDVLGLDCEGSGSLEVAYELRNSADFLLTCEAPRGDQGWPLATLLGPALLQESTPALFAEAMAGKGLSSTCLGKLEQVGQTLAAFSQACLREGPWCLDSSLPRSLHYGQTVDLGDLALQVLEDHGEPGSGLQAPALPLVFALGEAISRCGSEAPGEHGLSIALTDDSTYGDLALSRDTGWPQVLAQLREKPGW